jgi:hypothetical protein
MSRASFHDVSQLLLDWGKGDRAALEAIIPLVYKELKRLDLYPVMRGGLGSGSRQVKIFLCARASFAAFSEI